VVLGVIVAHPLAQHARGRRQQTAYIKASNTETGDHFGNGGTLEGDSVAISGDGNTLAVGRPNESSNAKGINGNQATIPVFSRRGLRLYPSRRGNWSQQAYVRRPTPATAITSATPSR
jgi:hypothetical protein